MQENWVLAILGREKEGKDLKVYSITGWNVLKSWEMFSLRYEVRMGEKKG